MNTKSVSLIVQEKKDLVVENLEKISFINGGRFLSKFELTDSLLKDLCKPWEDGLIIELLGKYILFVHMREGLQRI